MSDPAPNKLAHAPLADPTALAKFGKLEVVARLVVEGYMVGQHKSPYKGSSVEFVEHRQYYPGDEIRHIDWRAYGKTGKYYIKEFEDETNLRCYVLVDASGSMAYAKSTLSKFDYAQPRGIAGLFVADAARRHRPNQLRHANPRPLRTDRQRAGLSAIWWECSKIESPAARPAWLKSSKAWPTPSSAAACW